MRTKCLFGLMFCLGAMAMAGESFDEVKLPENVLFVVRGIENSIARLDRTQGHARYEEKFNDNPSTILHYDFFTDGDKFRYDTSVEDTTNKGAKRLLSRSKYACDGEAVYTFQYTYDGEPVDRAHIRPLEEKWPVERGTWTGTSFVPQALYLPQDLLSTRPLDKYLRKRVGKGYSEVLVEGNVATDPCVVLVIRSKIKNNNLSIRLTVDIAHGFTLPLVEYISNGTMVAKSTRKYEEEPVTGHFLLTEYDSLYEEKDKLKKITKYSVKYEKAVKASDPKTYTVAGFDLSPGTTIQDTRYNNLKFRVGGPDMIGQVLEEKLVNLPKPKALVKAGSDITATESKKSPEPIAQQNGSGAVTSVTVAQALLYMVLPLIAILGTTFYLWKRKSYRK